MNSHVSKRHMVFYVSSMILSLVLFILSLIYNILTVPLINQQVILKKEIKALKTENTRLFLDYTERTRFEEIEAYALDNHLLKATEIIVIK